jgi:type I restriction enzyme S subunit
MSPEALPREWSWRVLQDIGKIVTGNTPSTSEPAFWGGSIPFVTPTDLGQSAVVSSTGRSLSNEGAARARLLPPRSVLVTCIASIGKNALASTSCCTNQQINAVVCNESAWPEYIYYGLCYRTAELQRIAGATAVSIVSKGRFEQFGLPLPPLPEQRKIAAILSSVDEAIEGTQAVIDQLQVVKKAMMADLLTRGIPGRHKKFKQTEIGEVPDEWDVVPLRAVSTLVTKGATPTTFGYDYVDSNAQSAVRFLRATNASPDGEFRDDDPKYIPSEAHHSLKRSALMVDDCVISIVGARVGTSFRVRAEHLPANINQNVALIRPRTELVMPAFVSLCIVSHIVQDRIAQIATTQAQPSLSLEQVGHLHVPLPPLLEQEAISIAVASVADRIVAERTQATHLQTVKAALMSVLLSGEVRVRVDDEATCD